MTDIKVAEDLWSTSMLPEGMVEKWLVPNGATVKCGEPVAEIRIEGALHTIVAPAAGSLSISAGSNAVVDPGCVVGQIKP